MAEYRGLTDVRTLGFEGLVPYGIKGLHLPPRYAIEVDDPGCPFLVEIHVVVVEGRPRCAELRCRMRPGGSPLLSVNFKGFPLAGYVRESALLYAVRSERDENGEVVFVQATDTGDRARVGRAAKPRPRREMTDKFLRGVARVYTKAESKPVMAAVMRRFDSSRPMAGKWVTLARERGFLAPSTREGRR